MHRALVLLLLSLLAGCGRASVQPPPNPSPQPTAQTPVKTEAAPKPKVAPQEAVFAMREVSVFDLGGTRLDHIQLIRGQSATCSPLPDKTVKAYPKLKSKRPLYGKVQFDRGLSGGKGIEFHFVLDESGEALPGNEMKTKTKAGKTPSPPQSPDPSDGSEPDQPGKEPELSRYDRLYFDVNRDLDLASAPVLKPMKDPPWQALPAWPEVRERTVFEWLNVNFDYGPGVGVRPLRIMPWFASNKEGNDVYNTMFFVATTARQGRIRLGKHEYNALLAQPYNITGRFDRLRTALYLTALDPKDKIEFWGFESGLLMGMQRVDDQLYTIAATPLGDKLIVKPYGGDLGVFQVGPGGRDIKEISLYGSFRSETAAVGVGPDRTKPEGERKKASEYPLPVGDYVPSLISIQYGRLKIELSDNYHTDGRPRDMERHHIYPITIRKDKPYVLDFSNKPKVLFASPAKDMTFRPGDEIRVAAVLTDPALDMMIRGLDDTTRKKKETVNYGNGLEGTVERRLSLDPVVTITDSAGKTVAEGTMPFG